MRVLLPALLLLAAMPAARAAPGGAVAAAEEAAPPARVWEAPLPAPDAAGYAVAVEAALAAWEADNGRRLGPGPRGRAALKVYTGSGAGLATPRDLVRAVAAALERRGFARSGIFLLDASETRLREAGYLPPLSEGGSTFEGLEVRALDSGRWFDDLWFYDSPLPDRLVLPGRLSAEDDVPAGEPGGLLDALRAAAERRSPLAYPLIAEVDLWINLPMATDHPAFGVNGALANATLWNAGNTARFLRSGATAPAAMAEMAAIPELRATWALTVLSLERYQFIGGPTFHSLYTRGEPVLLVSDNPVAIDEIALGRLEQARREAGFRAVDDDRVLALAALIGLGRRLPGGPEIRPVTIP